MILLNNGNASISVVPATSRGFDIFYASGVMSTLDCGIDEIRISKGIARWTENFTGFDSLKIDSIIGEYEDN